MALIDQYDITNKAIQCDPSFDPQRMNWFKNSYHRLKIVTDKRSVSSRAWTDTVSMQIPVENRMDNITNEVEDDSHNTAEIKSPSLSPSPSPSPSLPTMSLDISGRSHASTTSTGSAMTTVSSVCSRSTTRSRAPAISPSTTPSPSIFQFAPSQSVLTSASVHMLPNLNLMRAEYFSEIQPSNGIVQWIRFMENVIVDAQRHQLYFAQFLQRK